MRSHAPHLAAVAAIVLTGCSATGMVSTTTAAATSAATVESTTGDLHTDRTLANTDVVSPVLEFQGGGLTSDEIHNAKTRAVSSCMQQRGWTYEPLIQRTPIAEPRTVEQLREFRREYGYGVFTVTEEGNEPGLRAADRNHAYYSALGVDEQRDYRRDLNGDVEGSGATALEGSCEALGNAATGIPIDDQAVMTELQILYGAIRQSIEFQGAVEDWRACLADRGFEFDRDGSPIDLLFDRARSGIPTQELAALEVEIARADFECAFSTTMPVLHSLEAEIVRELVERYPEWGR